MSREEPAGETAAPEGADAAASPAARGGRSRTDRASARRRRVAVVLAFPALIVVLAGLLTALNLNGSSIALLSTQHAHDPRVVAGTPRVIRSDEYTLASPAQVGNVAKGKPVQSWIGLTNTDLDATSLGAPTASWVAAFQPITWPFFVLPVERGFDGHWWLFLVVPLVGVYFLLMTLRPRSLLASALAVVASLSPLVAWWSNSPGPIIGFLAAATALVLLGTRARRWWSAVLLGAGAGYLAVAAFFALYPPWLLAAGLVMLAVVVGDMIERRTPVRRLALTAVPAVVVLGSVLATWSIQSSTALSAITGTIYPGNRISSSGGGRWSFILSTALNPVFADNPTHITSVPATNQSDVSSAWFPLPVLLVLVALVIVAIATARRTRARRPAMLPDDGTPATGSTAEPDARPAAAVAADVTTVRSWATFLAVTAAMTLELLWMFAPLPAVVGRITLLNRVPGDRVTIALGVGTVLLLHLAAGRLTVTRPVVRVVLWAGAAVATGALALWSAGQLLTPGATGVPLAVVSGVVVAACFAGIVLMRRPWPALAVLVVVVAVNYAIVNPLYRGLGPLNHGQLARTLASLASAEGSTKWADLAGGGSTSVMSASPEQVLSGMTYYPSRDVWERLAPAQEQLWNNFAKYVWKNDPSARPVTLTRVKGSIVELRIDLCSPDVAFLDIHYVVTTPKTPPPACYTPVQTVQDLGGTYVISRHRSS